MYEALVIGTGFGGGVLSARLAKRWPGQILVVERGKRYGFGSFPRSPHEMARNFYPQPGDGHRRPKFVTAVNSTGLFDIRSYDHIDVVLAAGLGGGSLIYANVFLEPPPQVFDERWPSTCKKNDLERYYAVAKKVLGARPVPIDENDPRRRLTRTQYFQKAAAAMGRKSELVPIMVHFGNDHERPLAPGLQEVNRHGALQSSCIYCAECDIGCNVQSKNSTDHNYLFVAEKKHGATILTEHEARSIAPLNAAGQIDPSADGRFGYAVTVVDLQQKTTELIKTKRVIVAAGTLGTNELLLRCKDQLKTLPRVSSQLGSGFSGNGDFLSFIVDAKEPADPNYGPVITQRIDFNLYDRFDKDRAFVMQDASYPNILAWFIEGQKPGILKLQAIWDGVLSFVRTIVRSPMMGRMGGVISRFLGQDLSYKASVHLCMGLDRSDGRLGIDKEGRFGIHWPYKNSLSLYQAIDKAVKQFRTAVGGRLMFHMPTWGWPLRRNVTVHPLGGCALSEDPTRGVTDAAPSRFGAVHGYEHLFVADGSLFPSAVGANPAATIAALAERVAEGITGLPPTEDL